MHILTLCGSLRASSSNLALLQGAARVAPAEMEFAHYDEIGTLPHFNPDLDFEGAIAPPSVAAWRARLARADAVVLCSPEYAHGVPGSLKNALDWIVSSGELTDKPIALLNASPMGGQLAQESLCETLTVMGARVVREASRLAPFVSERVQPEKSLDAKTAAALADSMRALAAAVAPR